MTHSFCFKGISWFRHFRSFPLFHGFHLNVDFTGNRSDPRSNFLHTQHREIVTICLFERASFNPLNERNGNKIIITEILSCNNENNILG